MCGRRSGLASVVQRDVAHLIAALDTCFLSAPKPAHTRKKDIRQI